MVSWGRCVVRPECRRAGAGCEHLVGLGAAVVGFAVAEQVRNLVQVRIAGLALGAVALAFRGHGVLQVGAAVVVVVRPRQDEGRRRRRVATCARGRRRRVARAAARLRAASWSHERLEAPARNPKNQEF